MSNLYKLIFCVWGFGFECVNVSEGAKELCLSFTASLRKYFVFIFMKLFDFSNKFYKT